MSIDGPKSVSEAQQPIPARPSVGKVFPPLTYLVGFAILFGLTLTEHKPPQPANTSEGRQPEISSTGLWYEHMIGTPDPRDSHVAVITVGKDMPKDFGFRSAETSANSAGAGKDRIGQETENSATSSSSGGAAAARLPEACRRRLYIAELLKALANLYPRVVVLDIWFDPEFCSDERVTRILFDALGQFSKAAPIILGLPSRNATDFQVNSPAEFRYMSNRKPPLGQTELVLMPVTHPPQSTDGRLVEAVVRRSSDATRIPLSWSVYDRLPKDGVQPRRAETLSVAAVRAFDSHHPTLKKIDALSPDGSPKVSTEPYPYTSLRREDQLPIQRALDVICSRSADAFWKNICAQSELLTSDPNVFTNIFTNKVIVIGLVGLGGDLHETTIGTVPGVILQADYIESLLSGPLFKPLSLTCESLLGALGLAIAVGAGWCFRLHPLRAVTLSLLAAILFSYGTLQILIWRGYYTQFLVPVIGAALFVNVTLTLHHFLLHQGGDHE